MYKLIIFDWDGTLMDSEAKIVSCLRASLQTLNLEARTDDQLKDVIGLGMIEAIMKLFPDLSEQQISLFRDEYKDQFFEKNKTSSTLFEGVVDMLHFLKKSGLLLAVATGKGRNGLNRILEKTQLQALFDSTRCAGETLSKPDPLMLKQILEELDLSAQQSLMVGDTVYDLEMARNIEMDTVAITHGVHSAERLLAYQPVTNVSCINELHQWFKNLV